MGAHPLWGALSRRGLNPWTASAFNWLGQCANSPGNRAYWLTAYYLILKHFSQCKARSAKRGIAIVIILSTVAPFWNIQLKHKPFNWHHPIQCCKMKIAKISDVFDIFENISISSIPGFITLRQHLSAVTHLSSNPTRRRATMLMTLPFSRTRRRRRFRIDRGPLRGSSSPLRHFKPARVKPN